LEKADRDDILQDVYQQIWNTHVVNQLPIRSEPDAVVRIAIRNAVIRHFNLQDRMSLLSEESQTADPGSASEVDIIDTLLDFYVLVEQWPTKGPHRRDWIRAWIKGKNQRMTISEIAAQIQVSVESLRSAVWSFLRWVRQNYSDMQF
jgi:hypothetical protein